VHKAIGEGLISSCHELCEGGLAAAAAEMVIGADGLGVELDSNLVPTTETLTNISALFAEAPTRFIAEVSPQNLDRFAEVMRGNQWATIGQITDSPQLELKHDGVLIYCASRSVLATANQVPA
jgi:phosphoribosylformylglycinamidine (FGAM) synthase-like enzyme